MVNAYEFVRDTLKACDTGLLRYRDRLLEIQMPEDLSLSDEALALLESVDAGSCDWFLSRVILKKIESLYPIAIQKGHRDPNINDYLRDKKVLTPSDEFYILAYLPELYHRIDIPSFISKPAFFKSLVYDMLTGNSETPGEYNKCYALPIQIIPYLPEDSLKKAARLSYYYSRESSIPLLDPMIVEGMSSALANLIFNIACQHRDFTIMDKVWPYTRDLELSYPSTSFLEELYSLSENGRQIVIFFFENDYERHLDSPISYEDFKRILLANPKLTYSRNVFEKAFKQCPPESREEFFQILPDKEHAVHLKELSENLLLELEKTVAPSLTLATALKSSAGSKIVDRILSKNPNIYFDNFPVKYPTLSLTRHILKSVSRYRKHTLENVAENFPMSRQTFRSLFPHLNGRGKALLRARFPQYIRKV